MLVISLLLLSQTYTIDPEPIMQVHESWMEDAWDGWVDPTLGQNQLTVGQAIDLNASPNPQTGEISAAGYWREGSYGYDASTNWTEWQSNRDKADLKVPIQPVIAIETDGKLHFMWNEKLHNSWFYINWLGCKSCWKVLATDSKFEPRFRQALYDIGRRGWVKDDWDYDTLVEYHDSWDRKILSYDKVQRLVWPEDRFKAPWMLHYVRGYVASEPKRSEVGAAPEWVKSRLRDNERWIATAIRMAGIAGLGEFYQKNGYIPGDRTNRDMQYTFALRGSIDFSEYKRRITYGVRCGPEFGVRGFGPGGRFTQCAEQLYNEEMDVNLREVDEIDALIERYLGGS